MATAEFTNWLNERYEQALLASSGPTDYHAGFIAGVYRIIAQHQAMQLAEIRQFAQEQTEYVEQYSPASADYAEGYQSGRQGAGWALQEIVG